MAEIDPVILELRAELGKYRADLKSTTSQVERLLGNQERSVQRLERQMLKSSSAISGAIRAIGAGLGTYFSGREVVGLVDNFIRLQNSLKVAGLEGANLERVQSSLLDLSSRYGVSVGELANLYGKSAQAASDLGASEAQLLQITEASAQALKITGTSAVQAQGALLGLTQALASGTVRAEEFNQINEGGLRPLLQIAANAEKYGGSVAKLRIAVVDGKVSSQEFYQAILNGSAELEGKASKATLTLAGAFEALTSRLTVYIGQSAEANGVTAALAGAMQLLGENLDKVIPALAVIGAGLGVGLVTNAVRARVALLAASGAAVTLSGTATAAGRALLAAFGGPVGVAITALVVGIGYLVSQTEEAVRAAKEAELQAIRTASAQETEKRATELLAAAKGSEKTAQIAATKASRDRAAQALQTAKALQAEAKAALVAARAQAQKIFENSAGDTGFLATLGRGLGGAGAAGPTITPGTGKANRISLNVSAAQAKLDASERKIAALEGEVDGLSAAIGDGANAPKLAPASSDGKKVKTKKGPKDRSEDLAARAAQDLYQIQIEELRAKAQLATDATERASIEREILGKERDAREADIAAAVKSGDLTKQQADAQREILAKLYGRRDAESAEGDILVQAQKSLYAMQVAREERLQLFEDEKELAQTEFNAQSDALRQQYDLAKSQAERRQLALKIIDLEYEFRDSQLEAVKNNRDLSEAVRQRAAIEQAALREAQGRTVEQARRDTAGPLENYFDRAKMDANELNEAYQQVAVDGLGAVQNALADTAAEYIKLGGVAGKIVNGIIADLIRLAIQQQIVGLLGSVFSAGSASSGSSGSSGGTGLPSFFGRTSGGYNAPHSITRVNEHAGGVELLRMGSQGGTVIPLGQANSPAAQPASARQGPIELRVYADRGAFISDVEAISEGQAVKVTMAAAGPLTERAVQTTMGRLNRPRMPGAGR